MIKIKIWGSITEHTSSAVESVLSNIENDNEPVMILLNSVGGNLSDTVAICNLLKAIPNPIITVCLGNCMSAAVMIFCAGHKRYIGKDTNFMIHQPYYIAIDAELNSSIIKHHNSKLKNASRVYKERYYI